MPTTDAWIETAQSYAERLRSFTELDASDADPGAYGAVVIAMSNIAIASAIQDLANATWAQK